MTTYVERDCIVTHEGRSFEAGGAVVTPEVCIGYVGKVANGHRELTDWHGKPIGTILLGNGWPTPRNYLSSRMYQAYATVNGVTYTGRTGGEGLSFKGKRVK